MEIVLLRHAQTAGNLAGKYIGRTDEPLCETGVMTAQKAGVFPSVSRVAVSPMLRARETASILFPNAEQCVYPDLREMDFGSFEGKSAEEMHNDPKYLAWVDSNCLAPCPNGESVTEFYERVRTAFGIAVQDAISRGESRLITVTHGGVIMAVMQAFAVPKRALYDWYSKNCCGWRARLCEAVWESTPELFDYERLEVLRF